MQLPCLKSPARVLCTLTIASALASSAWAQGNQSTSVPQAPSASRPPASAKAKPFVVGEYSKGRSHVPNPIAPYVGINVASPNLTNTPRLDQLLQNGKLMLSMSDAIALTLENNLDIAISRYNLSIADTDVLRSKAGSTILGVNSGVVQGTPGGGVGGFGGATTASGGAGGTTAGGGGGGAGTLGIVSSTLGIGSPVSSYDPILTGTLSLDRNNVPSTSFFSGGFQNTATVDWTYQQGFQTGTQMSLAFNNSRFGQANPIPTVSPELSSNFRFQLTQHLLQGFGFLPNKRFIIIAKNNRELTDVAFRLQITTTVDQIQNMYWDLVNAYENVKVQQDALALADKTLSDNKKQVEIGTLAPIEIVRAQSQVATNQQSLIVAKTNLELQQLLMKNALSRTLVDPALIDAEVIPTDTMRVLANEPVVPSQELINDALSHRPELAESRIDLHSREVSLKAVKNAMLPSLDLFAYYGGQGLGGSQNPNNLCTSPNSIPGLCTDPNAVPSKVFQPISIGNTLGQLFDSSHPDKGAGISLNIPLRNRTAQANQIRSQLEYRQAQMRLQQVENEVRIEVRNAQFALQQNKASVAAAQAAVDLAQQSLEAEQKKYALGASTSTLVLQQSSALTQSRSNLVGARAAYEKARVELDRATGLLLEHNGIDLADAQSGVVSKLPNVPYVMPRSEVKPEVVPQLPTQTVPDTQTSPPQN